MIMRQAQRAEGLRDGEMVITALAEATRALLVGRGWEAEGFWRWEYRQQAAGNRQAAGTAAAPCPLPPADKRFYVWGYWRRTAGLPEFVPIPVTMRPNRIREAIDLPHAFRPLTLLTRGPGLPRAALPQDPPQNMSAAMKAFEERLLTALRVDDALINRERGWLAVKAYPLQTRPGPGDVRPEQITRFRPSKEQLADYEIVMPWLGKLAPKDRNRLWAKARGVSLRTIAEREKINVKLAAERIGKSVATCWHAARQSERTAACSPQRRPQTGAGRTGYAGDRRPG